MNSRISYAPGWPGSEPRWTSSAKTGLGTALNQESPIWFTLSHGILNEIYFPRVDQACTRDMGLIVTDGREFFSEEKRHTLHETTCLAPGVPAYQLVNSCVHAQYRIEKEILTDTKRPVLLQRTRFVALQGAAMDYHLYVLLAPHLANHGGNNTGWVGDHNGAPMLFAERGGCALALACSTGWRARSIGFIALPASRGTSCIFGGPEYRTLYITTATETLTEAQLAEEPLAGSLLACEPGFTGIPETPFAG